MKKEMVLLFNGQYWGAYDDFSCPDIGIDPQFGGLFPKHFYRKYIVDQKSYLEKLLILAEWAKDLHEKGILPDEKNYEKVCPSAEELFET